MRGILIGCLTLFFCCPVLQSQTANDLLGRVQMAMSLSKERQAVSYFRQAIELDADRAEMFYWMQVDKHSSYASKLMNELAASFRKKRNFDKAFLFYKELLQMEPHNVAYLEGCAEMQVGRGKEKEALRLYEQILQLDSDNLAANIFLGNYYFLAGEQEKKKLDAAFQQLSAPTRMQYARYRDELSRLFMTYEKARASLQKVLKCFPSTEARKTLNKIATIEKEVNR